MKEKKEKLKKKQSDEAVVPANTSPSSQSSRTVSTSWSGASSPTSISSGSTQPTEANGNMNHHDIRNILMKYQNFGGDLTNPMGAMIQQQNFEVFTPAINADHQLKFDQTQPETFQILCPQTKQPISNTYPEGIKLEVEDIKIELDNETTAENTSNTEEQQSNDLNGMIPNHYDLFYQEFLADSADSHPLGLPIDVSSTWPLNPEDTFSSTLISL